MSLFVWYVAEARMTRVVRASSCADWRGEGEQHADARRYFSQETEP